MTDCLLLYKCSCFPLVDQSCIHLPAGLFKKQMVKGNAENLAVFFIFVFLGIPHLLIMSTLLPTALKSEDSLLASQSVRRIQHGDTLWFTLNVTEQLVFLKKEKGRCYQQIDCLQFLQSFQYSLSCTWLQSSESMKQ